MEENKTRGRETDRHSNLILNSNEINNNKPQLCPCAASVVNISEQRSRRSRCHQIQQDLAFKEGKVETNEKIQHMPT